MFRSIDPATATLIQRYDTVDDQALEEALQVSVQASRRWLDEPLQERIDKVHKLAKILLDEEEELARMVTREVGKPLAEARSEVQKCAWLCNVVADSAAQALADEHVEMNSRQAWVSYEPMGVMLAIMPWNYPFWQAIRAAAPALVAGNSVLLKHAPNVPGCALEIERIIHKAGFGDGACINLFADNDQIARIIADRRVAGVTLTGSVGAGKSVGALAGAAIKPVVLELGGSDPFVVLQDADLDAALNAAILSRFGNAGQSCIAAKRLIVEAPVYEAFTERLQTAIESLPVGDPLDPATRIGPMARADLRDQLHRQVERSIQSGARLACGGAPVDRPGFFYQPTLLSEVAPGMAAFDEELFGPVASVIRAADADDALRLADLTPFGLGASIWSANVDKALALGRRIRSGMLSINDFVRSDPRLPFGGVRESGVGRELGTPGIRSFVNIRTIQVAGQEPGG